MNNDNFRNEEVSSYYNLIQVELSQFWNRPMGSPEMQLFLLKKAYDFIKMLNKL